MADETQNNSDQMRQNPEEEGAVGPIAGSIIIIVIIIIGGLYFWGKAIDEDVSGEDSPEEIRNAEDKQLEQLRAQSNSDELGAIEEDLENTDLNDIDRELQEIEEELN